MLLFNDSTYVRKASTTGFQNISCYCLTGSEEYAIEELDAFQNISCYCLTKRYAFNYSISLISKHLMLLFNNYSIPAKTLRHIFQNISCYCLTNDFTSFFNCLFKKNNDFMCLSIIFSKCTLNLLFF